MAKKPKSVDLSFLRGEGERTDLSGLFAAGVSDIQQARSLRVEQLLDNPYQPRQALDDATLDDLAQVIRTQGFQGVLVARPHPGREGLYQLTAGHRRREAAKRAGLSVLPIVIRELSDEEMVVLAITENVQREDLTPLEEGRLYLLMDEELGYTHEQIAREIGKHRGYVENRIRVARAPEDVQALVLAKPDSLRAVSTLIKVSDTAQRAEIIDLMLRGKLTADDLPGYVVHRATEHEEGPAGAEAAVTRPRSARRPAPDDEHTRRRIGAARLTAVLRSLNTYQAALGAHDELSMQEYAGLLQIRSLVEGLCDRYAIKLVVES